MKKINLTFLFFLFLLPLKYTKAQSLTEDMRQLKNMLDTYHISPPVINDDFSKNVFRRFIEMLDPKFNILNKQDYEKIKSYETSIDEDYKESNPRFLKAFLPLFKEKLLRYQAKVIEICSQPLDFTVKDRLVSLKEEDPMFHLKDDLESDRVLEKRIKYQCLTLFAEDKAENKPALESYIGKVRDTELRKIKNILEHANGFENYVQNKFLLAISLCYDPHTEYMDVSDLINFKSSLSSESLSFGFYCDENEKEEIEVVELIPGGPAWNSGNIHQGDILISIQWKGKEVIDLNGAGVEEVYTALEQSAQGTATFAFKNKEGEIQKITLTKAATRQDENIVKGFIIEGRKKIGYISLPGFYSEDENDLGSGCANDVGSLIIKMKKEGIEALILDVRFNGGGSMKESADLAGIFIDQGPLSVFNTRQNIPTLYKDANRGTIFDGPMVLMVNHYSASASEMLAASLQDYNRAIIVGANTFGKATAQVILPLKEANSATGMQSTSSNQFIKVTNRKIYRVNGRTAQLIGVQPNIELVDASGIDYQTEGDFPHAIKEDILQKKIIYTPYPAIPLDTIKSLHQKRFNEQNPLYKLVQSIEQYNDALLELKFNDVPLDQQGYMEWFKKTVDMFPKEEQFVNQENLLKVKILEADMAWLNQDQYAKEMHQRFQKNISSDLYIKECCEILADWISIK